MIAPKRHTESPIEDRFWMAFRRVCAGSRYMAPVTMDRLTFLATEDGEGRHIFIGPQVWIGRYRVDFLLAANNRATRVRLLCVECDGRAFHMANAAQRRRDAIRDAWLRSKDIAVVRYTGRQITQDAMRCARDAALRVSDRRRLLTRVI